jgi:hypothetical protein
MIDDQTGFRTEAEPVRRQPLGSAALIGTGIVRLISAIPLLPFPSSLLLSSSFFALGTIGLLR